MHLNSLSALDSGLSYNKAQGCCIGWWKGRYKTHNDQQNQFWNWFCWNIYHTFQNFDCLDPFILHAGNQTVPYLHFPLVGCWIVFGLHTIWFAGQDLVFERSKKTTRQATLHSKIILITRSKFALFPLLVINWLLCFHSKFYYSNQNIHHPHSFLWVSCKTCLPFAWSGATQV